MSSSTSGPAAWSVAASAYSNSEASPASGASSGFDSDSSPSSVNSSSGLCPGPPPSCSHLGARPKAGRHAAAVPPPPPPPIGRLSSAGDQLLDGTVSPPWLLNGSGGGNSQQYLDHPRTAQGCGGLDRGGGDCDQPCNQSGKTKRMRNCYLFLELVGVGKF
jgi:hypothetical protein